jgi:hypothetical protein
LNTPTKGELNHAIRWTIDYWTGERYLNMVRMHNRYIASMAKEADAQLAMTLQMSWSLLRSLHIHPEGEWVDALYDEISRENLRY